MKRTYRLAGSIMFAASLSLLSACSILPKPEMVDVYRLPAAQAPIAASQSAPVVIGFSRRSDHFTGAPWLVAMGACAAGSRYTSTISGLGRIEQALSKLRPAARTMEPARR